MIYEDNANALEQMLSDVDGTNFFEKYWETGILHDISANKARFAQLLDIKKLDSLLAFGRLRESQIRVIDSRRSIKVKDYIASGSNSCDPLVDPKKIVALYQKGATLGFNAVNFATHELNQFCLSLEQIFFGRVQANVYLTPPAAQGLNPHFDTHCVFLLQIFGRKAWKIYGSPEKYPLKGQRFNAETQEMGSLVNEIILKTGDMLYIPRGVIHEGVAGNDEASCHITIGIHTQKWSDALRHAIKDGLESNFKLRRSVLPGHNREFKLDEAIEDIYSEFISTVSDREAFIKKLKSNVESYDWDNSQLLVDGRLESAVRFSEIDANSLVSIVEDSEHSLVKIGDQVRLISGEKTLDFPDYVLSTLELIYNSKQIRVRDIDGDVDEEGVLVMIKRLIKEGFLALKA